MKILITGGSGGLGKAIVNQLSAIHDVYFTYCNNQSTDANAIHLDFSISSSVNALTEWIEAEQPDVLINNALNGLNQSHAHKIISEDHNDGFQQNVAPVIQLTNSFIKKARKRKCGKVINVLSSYIIGKPPIGMSQYIAQKNYLLSLNKSWASENISFNITSNAISPSIMQTKLTEDTDERVFEQMIASHPLKRLIEPKEVAEVVEFMINASPFLNGQNIVLNHGENLI
jgi:NAD(P)-dependent dehydrogenase (short-subunit alcohol dehydrogenase family)